jgi:hypothetical protein
VNLLCQLLTYHVWALRVVFAVRDGSTALIEDIMDKPESPERTLAPTLKLDPALFSPIMSLPSMQRIVTQMQDQQMHSKELRGMTSPMVPMQPDIASRPTVVGASYIEHRTCSSNKENVCNSQKRSSDSHSATATSSAVPVAKRQRYKDGHEQTSLTSKGNEQAWTSNLALSSTLLDNPKSPTDHELAKEVQAYMQANEVSQVVASQEVRASQSLLSQLQQPAFEPGLLVTRSTHLGDRWGGGESCCRRDAVSGNV